MIDLSQVIDACVQFGEQSINAAAFGAHIIHTDGLHDLRNTHLRAVGKASSAARAADAALAILFAAAKAWGYDPAPFTDYQAHPNGETRAKAMALALSLRVRAEAEQDLSDTLPARPADDLFAAEDYRVKHGLPPKRLDRARRDGRLTGQKRHGRWYYSKSEVSKLWPDAFASD